MTELRLTQQQNLHALADEKRKQRSRKMTDVCLLEDEEQRVKLEMRQLLLQTSHKEKLEVECCECWCRYPQMRRIRGLAFRYYWLGRLEGTTGLRGSQFDAKEDIKIRGDHCDHKLVISPPLLPLIPKDVTVAMQGTGAIHVTIYLAGGTLVISIVSHLPLYGVSVAQFYRANQPSTRVSRSSVPKRYVMKETLSDLPDSALYTKQNICDNTLDDAQLETRCPLDNGRHADALMSTHYPAGQLDQLPAELLIQILLQIDIPSLTHFRLVNRRAMGLVDPIPHEPPSVLSLPGRYCTAWGSGGGNLARKRLQLFDRQSVVQSLTGSSVPKLDKTTREPRRFMAIITAPHLLDAGRQADWGYFCLGCREEKEEKTNHFRIKYIREDILEHIARYGSVEEMPRIPGRFMHVSQT
ncbi:hypothetical protein EV126DRAFT_482972 [Verticillium dahliae]|nr:hypothetical protein EV126DRAFT_482972 [Verticillium dahliae]